MKIRVIILVFIIVFALSSLSTYASSYLGTLYIWHSDKSSIMHWDGNVYVRLSNMDYTFDKFNQSVNHAIDQWNDAGIDVYSTTSTNYDIRFYGGTYSQLVLLSAFSTDLESTMSGLCVYGSYGTNYNLEGYYNLNTSSTLVNSYDLIGGVKCCIVHEAHENSNRFKKVATHELGHTLGWQGHSSVSTDIMCQGLTYWLYLTTRDKEHLMQVY